VVIESYLVRVHRVDHEQPQCAVGTVKVLSSETEHRFKTLDELSAILRREIRQQAYTEPNDPP